MKKIKGSCLCNNISFEIYNECRYSVLCHCTMCQKANAEFSNYTKVKKDNFKFLKKKILSGLTQVRIIKEASVLIAEVPYFFNPKVLQMK